MCVYYNVCVCVVCCLSVCVYVYVSICVSFFEKKKIKIKITNKHATVTDLTIPESDNDNSILEEICLAGYDDIVAKIVEKCEQLKITLNLRSTKVLKNACKVSLKCVQLLLKSQIDYRPIDAIKYVCSKQDISILTELIEYEKNNKCTYFDTYYWRAAPKESENVKEYFKLLLDYQVSHAKYIYIFFNTLQPDTLQLMSILDFVIF